MAARYTALHPERTDGIFSPFVVLPVASGKTVMLNKAKSFTQGAGCQNPHKEVVSKAKMRRTSVTENWTKVDLWRL